MQLSARIGLCAVVAAAASSAHATTVVQPFNFTQASGADQVTSAMAQSGATGYVWQISLTSLIANGILFGQNIPLPLGSYGINPIDLTASGTAGPSLPSNLYFHEFSFTDVGGLTPAYDFTVSMDLLANQSVQTTVNVISFGMFTAGGITGSPLPVPVTSITATGTSQVTPLPAPGSLALLALGGVLAARRRRRS